MLAGGGGRGRRLGKPPPRGGAPVRAYGGGEDHLQVTRVCTWGIGGGGVVLLAGCRGAFTRWRRGVTLCDVSAVAGAPNGGAARGRRGFAAVTHRVGRYHCRGQEDARTRATLDHWRRSPHLHVLSEVTLCSWPTSSPLRRGETTKAAHRVPTA